MFSQKKNHDFFFKYSLGKEIGSGQSDPYRFLSKGQQWIFIQTNCQVQINSWTGKADSYICTSNLLLRFFLLRLFDHLIWFSIENSPTDSLQRQSSLLTFPSPGKSIGKSWFFSFLFEKRWINRIKCDIENKYNNNTKIFIRFSNNCKRFC